MCSVHLELTYLTILWYRRLHLAAVWTRLRPGRAATQAAARASTCSRAPHLTSLPR